MSVNRPAKLYFTKAVRRNIELKEREENGGSRSIKYCRNNVKQQRKKQLSKADRKALSRAIKAKQKQLAKEKRALRKEQKTINNGK